jgi:hypothetical protein
MTSTGENRSRNTRKTRKKVFAEKIKSGLRDLNAKKNQMICNFIKEVETKKKQNKKSLRTKVYKRLKKDSSHKPQRNMINSQPCPQTICPSTQPTYTKPSSIPQATGVNEHYGQLANQV